MTTDTPKHAALYARVSTERQQAQNTIASQLSALREHAQAHHYLVPEAWEFVDNGFSGRTLRRPALERLRDLIAEGTIETLLVFAPDRLSRSQVHHAILSEEFRAHGTAVVYLNSPPGETPEQRMFLQMQAVIAEYERAQMAERCRRGKRYRAQAGNLNVLAGAPYGYQYIKKTEQSQAYYRVDDAPAQVVRQVFELYTVDGLSLVKIATRLNAQGVPTRKQRRWRAGTLHRMLKNPAYAGRACFNKSESVEPKKMNRTSRQKGAMLSARLTKRDRPVEQWIGLPVPALVSQQTFDLAQERLASNQQLSARRTKQPSVLQGLLVCAHCGYALVRLSTRGAKRYHYYRCLGSDRRYGSERVCQAPGRRVEQLDELVWTEVWQLLNHPELIQEEIRRRLESHRQKSPIQQRQEQVSKEILRAKTQTDKLIDAYQENLVGLEELRQRIPELRKRQTALEKEEQSLALQGLEEGRLLEMTNSLEHFTEQLRHSAQHLDIQTKQRIVRLLVHQVVVGSETVTINHSIPLTATQVGQKLPVSALCHSRH
jgi:site-specific DNA recombinase